MKQYQKKKNTLNGFTVRTLLCCQNKTPKK